MRHYRRPATVDHHMNSAAYYRDNAAALDSVLMQTSSAAYEKCAALLDAVTYELFKTTERYHIVADHEGPLYHVEVLDIIAKLEAIMEKVDNA